MFKNMDIMGKGLRVGGLVSGGIATQLVQAKLIPMVYPKADAKISNVITLGIGTFAPDLVGMIGKKKGGKGAAKKPDFIGHFADGMVAISGANLVIAVTPAEVKKTLGLAGIAGDGNDDEWIVSGTGDYYDGSETAGGSEILGMPEVL